MLLINTAYEVPSSAPTSVSVRFDTVTASSVTVQWGEVPCDDRNGEITGYTAQAVRNEVVKGTMDVAGDTREATFSGLSPSTWYTVQVAAVNGPGTGPYSNGINVTTSGKYIHTVRS